MGCIQRWVRDGIYTAMGERCDIYSDGWERGCIQRWVRDGMYTAMGERRENGQMEQSKAIEYGSQKASPDVLKPPYIYMI
jgi:hypothetical protein